jgi:hypothetical protein
VSHAECLIFVIRFHFDFRDYNYPFLASRKVFASSLLKKGVVGFIQFAPTVFFVRKDNPAMGQNVESQLEQC